MAESITNHPALNISNANANYPASNVANYLPMLLKEVEITSKDIALKRTCLKELDAILKSLSSNWKVRPFGSAANGFSTRFSDLDATCFEEVASGKIASDHIAGVRPLLEQHSSFEIVEVVSAARIPIIKLRYQDILDVDLSFQNIEPLPNTQLLRAYAQLSSMIPYLGVLIKLWANAEGVCGAQHGHLSSYSLTLMVLYYMQVDIYVKMPCFPTWEFTGQKRLPDCANVHWQCPLQLHALVSRFFEFYATSHCWGYEVVSPRVGERFYANDSCFASLSGRDNTSMLHIEDPFLLTRNLNCVLGPTQQDLLYRKFCEAHADLESGKIPRGFIMALETHKAKNIERPIQLENGAVEQTSSTNRDEKPAMQKGSQERTQNGARANAMSEAVEIRRDGRRDVTAKQSAAPQRKQKISNKSIAPTPEDMPSTDLFNQPFSAAPTIDDRPKTLEEYIKDTEIADGTTWSL